MLFICKRQTCIIEAALITVDFKKDEDHQVIRFNVKSHSTSGLWTYDEVLKIRLTEENETRVWDIRDEIGKMIYLQNKHSNKVNTSTIRTEIFKFTGDKYGKTSQK